MDLLDTINRYRVDQNLPVLVANPDLDRMAQFLAEDMAENNYFSHTDSVGRNFKQRLRDFTNNISSAGENIAKVNSAEQAVLLWKNSPDHNSNMISPQYRTAGVGNSGDYWVYIGAAANNNSNNNTETVISTTTTSKLDSNFLLTVFILVSAGLVLLVLVIGFSR